MDESFHVPAAAKSERIAAIVGVPFWLAFAGVQIAGGEVALALPFLAMGVAYVWTVWRGFRLAHRGVVFDATGLGPAEDGVRLWTLPWEAYGGLRRSEATAWERLRHPERGGYEVLGRDGQVGFHYVPPQGGGTTAHLTVAARQELRRHLPPGAPDPFAPAACEPQRWVVAVSLLVAVAGGVGARIGLANPLSPLVFVGLVGAFVGLGGGLVALLETVSLVRWRRGWRPRTVPLASPPEEGPSFHRPLARHARKPLVLEEGRRYRTLEPVRRRRELRAGADAIWILVPLGAFAPAYVWMSVADPKFLPIAVLGFGFFASISVFGLSSSLGSRRLLASVDDTLWVHDGHLVVVRSEGEPLTLPLPTASDREALRRKARTGATDVWRLPGGGRYAINRTRLYATELPEEL